MGFFSSRSDGLHSMRMPMSSQEDKSVIKLIRSRFYGKGKGVHEPSKLKKSFEYSRDYPPSVLSTAQSRSERRLSAESGGDEHRQRLSPNSPPSFRPHATSTDAVTMTLAQRLNELASANAEGFLNDDEYRMLRQSIFERLVSLSNVPPESPVARQAASLSSNHGFAPLPRTESKASLGRTPSLATQNSVGSTVSNLLRRATSSVRMTKRAAVDRDDVSLASRISRPGASRPIPQLLNRQTSNSSLASESTRHIPFDLRSVSSRRSGKSTRTFYDMTDPNRQGTLSTRRGEPPSSFATKHMYNWQNTANDTLQTASELRAEIRSTESEQRRLLDAFNGLELSAFTGKPQHTMMDIESSTNVTVGRLAAVSPTLPQHLKLAESVSVVRQQELLNSGVDEIRRRREEVRERYRQRIDYLRAKLKSAEIRERVLRK